MIITDIECWWLSSEKYKKPDGSQKRLSLTLFPSVHFATFVIVYSFVVQVAPSGPLMLLVFRLLIVPVCTDSLAWWCSCNMQYYFFAQWSVSFHFLFTAYKHHMQTHHTTFNPSFIIVPHQFMRSKFSSCLRQLNGWNIQIDIVTSADISNTAVVALNSVAIPVARCNHGIICSFLTITQTSDRCPSVFWFGLIKSANVNKMF